MGWKQQVFQAFSGPEFRLTTPRRNIINYIAQSSLPFTAEELVEQLPSVGRATIYRTIEVLISGHWLARIHRQDGEHAYMQTHPHKHQLICTECGKIVLFDTCDLDAVLTQLGQRTGFSIHGHALEAFGICQQCQTWQSP